MLPLPSDAVPTKAREWSDVLANVLSWWFAGQSRCWVEGEPPAIAEVGIDLSRCRLTERPPPDVTIVGPTTAGPIVGRLQLHARNLVVRAVPVTVDASATDAVLAVGRTASGTAVVTLADAADGRVAVRLAPKDLDAALLEAARAGVPAGVDVRSVHATLVGRGPRELDVTVDVEAKKFMAFRFRVTGHLSVDDALTATATRLTVDGEGMAAGFAANLIRPQLAKLEGQPLSLVSFNLGSLRLRDVAVDVTDGLAVTATFGSGGRA